MSALKTVGDALDQGYEWIELYWKDGETMRGTLSANVGAFSRADELMAALGEMHGRLKSGVMVGGGLRRSTSPKYDPDESTWAVIFGAPKGPIVSRKKPKAARRA